MLALCRDAHPRSRTSHDLTDLLNQRDRDFCIASLRSRCGICGDDVCGPVVDSRDNVRPTDRTRKVWRQIGAR